MIVNITFLHLGNYWYAGRKSNCPHAKIITTKDECIEAAAQLELKYHSKVTITRNNRPAGCYTFVDKREVYFNTITDPSNASPELDTGGICKLGTILSATYF